MHHQLSVSGRLREHAGGYHIFIESVCVGTRVNPSSIEGVNVIVCLHTILPQSYLALTSSIAQHEVIGTQMERGVLTIFKCPHRLSEGMKLLQFMREKA